MKLPNLLPLLGFLAIASATAQTEIPANPLITPKKSPARAVGGGVDPGVKVDPAKKDPDVRYVTHIVLYQNRYWTSAEGKPLEAKIIAFEDIVATVPKGATEPVMSSPPENPTVVRDGKVRLLVDKKPVELALERLSRQDQVFVEQIKTSLAKKAAGKK